MVRAPCCEKMGLKKGPWTPEEDHILINYIQLYGHGNWRALPKQAGLLRCGKSCRLRWTNYLRPDIKRGNFSREEEDTIINLHETLGNRWSAIAARLPGRTDNEIKNVWHTHLKKRLVLKNNTMEQQKQKQGRPVIIEPVRSGIQEINTEYMPQESSSTDDMSSSVTTIDDNNNNNNTCVKTEEEESSSSESFVEIDDNFWTEVLSADDNSSSSTSVDADPRHATTDDDLSFSTMELNHGDYLYDNMDFWYNLLTTPVSGELPQI